MSKRYTLEMTRAVAAGGLPAIMKPSKVEDLLEKSDPNRGIKAGLFLGLRNAEAARLNVLLLAAFADGKAGKEAPSRDCWVREI